MGLFACSEGTSFESPGRFVMDSTYAEIRVRDGVPGSSCYVYLAYHYEVLGGVIDDFCLIPMQSEGGWCVSIDYFLGCYIPAGSREVEDGEFDLEETYEGIDTTGVIVRIQGIIPNGRLDGCSFDSFSYIDTLRAPVKRGLTFQAPEWRMNPPSRYPKGRSAACSRTP
jgi:hypothetical protein